MIVLNRCYLLYKYFVSFLVNQVNFLDLLSIIVCCNNYCAKIIIVRINIIKYTIL